MPGPFQFVERKSRDLVRVKKFPGYWNAGQIGYDEVVYYYVPDSTVRLSRVRAGDLDIAERIAPTDLKTVRDDANLALHSAQGLAVSHLMFNIGNGAKADTPLGKNEKLRQAFELAIDRNIINRVAFNSEFVADNQMIPPSSPFYSKAHPIPARDIAKAKQLISAAGMTRVPVELTYENALADGRVAQIVQSMAAEAGFDVKLLPLETASAIERYLSGNFEAYIGNWSGRADPDPTLVSFFRLHRFAECQQVLQQGTRCSAYPGAWRGERRQAKGAVRQGGRHLSRCAILGPALSPQLVLRGAQDRARHSDVPGWPVAGAGPEAPELTYAPAGRPGRRARAP